jgi:chaperonin GroES
MKTETREKFKVRPIGEQVLIRRDDAEDKSPGGIIYADSSKNKPSRGKVIAVGTGLVKEDGYVIPPQVAVGDRVVFGIYAAQEVTIEGTELLLVKESNIFCVIEGKE